MHSLMRRKGGTGGGEGRMEEGRGGGREEEREGRVMEEGEGVRMGTRKRKRLF